MPAMYDINFSDGRGGKFFGTRGNYYEFADGTRLDMHSTPAWCHRCGAIANAERIESFAELEQQLADLHDPTSELYKLTTRNLLEDFVPSFGRDFHASQVAETERRRAWRRTRVAPPKCIGCGSTDVLILPFDEPVPHPTEPGVTITLRCVGMCSTNFNEWFFTPEGDRIPRDTKPTYWRHPVLDADPSLFKRLLARFMRRQAARERRPPGG
jgi:hypothetical protein